MVVAVEKGKKVELVLVALYFVAVVEDVKYLSSHRRHFRFLGSVDFFCFHQNFEVFDFESLKLHQKMVVPGYFEPVEPLPQQPLQKLFEVLYSLMEFVLIQPRSFVKQMKAILGEVVNLELFGKVVIGNKVVVVFD